MKIIIAGGSGYLGKVLCQYYQKIADEIVVLTRSSGNGKNGVVKFARWDGKTLGSWCEHLESADILINLTGKSVNCRYTKENKREILASRVDSTRVLGQAINRLAAPPRLWVQCSSATIYNDSRDTLMTEQEQIRGATFSEQVCILWENEFDNISLPSTTRRGLLRVGIVIGRSDGAFPRLIKLAKLGLGGHQGDGRQYVSWIHERELCRIIEWLRTHPLQKGVFNCTAPQPVTNRAFMKTLRSVLRVPIGFPTSALVLSVGAWLIGTETELVLKSRKVYPQRLLDTGFVFEFPDLKSAIVDLCQREKRS